MIFIYNFIKTETKLYFVALYDSFDQSHGIFQVDILLLTCYSLYLIGSKRVHAWDPVYILWSTMIYRIITATQNKPNVNRALEVEPTNQACMYNFLMFYSKVVFIILRVLMVLVVFQVPREVQA